MDVTSFRGIDQFGPAYKMVYENDPHPVGSVDRRIQREMVRLSPQTVRHLYTNFTPTKSGYRRGSRPELEACLRAAMARRRSSEERVASIARFTGGLGERAPDDVDAMVFGGTEEEIIERGSDWCTDVARVGCALAQVAGLPARLVLLADLSHAYRAHAIVEVYRQSVWGAVDFVTNVVYRRRTGRPASARDLMRDPSLVRRHSRGEATPFTTPDQFLGVALANYFVWREREYDYSTGRVNDYYRPILDMARRGWPGGLRWIHGEDAMRPAPRAPPNRPGTRRERT